MAFDKPKIRWYSAQRGGHKFPQGLNIYCCRFDGKVLKINGTTSDRIGCLIERSDLEQIHSRIKEWFIVCHRQAVNWEIAVPKTEWKGSDKVEFTANDQRIKTRRVDENEGH